MTFLSSFDAGSSYTDNEEGLSLAFLLSALFGWIEERNSIGDAFESLPREPPEWSFGDKEKARIECQLKKSLTK